MDFLFSFRLIAHLRHGMLFDVQIAMLCSVIIAFNEEIHLNMTWMLRKRQMGSLLQASEEYIFEKASVALSCNNGGMMKVIVETMQTYRFIAQLFNSAANECCLTYTGCYIPWHIEIEIGM